MVCEHNIRAKVRGQKAEAHHKIRVWPLSFLLNLHLPQTYDKSCKECGPTHSSFALKAKAVRQVFKSGIGDGCFVPKCVKKEEISGYSLFSDMITMCGGAEVT